MFETTFSWIGLAVIVLFAVAYLLVFTEEKIHLHKSKPVMLAAGLIWILIAIAFQQEGRGAEVNVKLREILTEYSELFLFLLSAMSFVNTLIERRVFDSLRSRLSAANFSSRGVFWITGTCAFFLSPVADNLTTALVMGTVALSALGQDKKAIVGTLVSIVVAANAGGAFSPFGDITTLMVWQKGVVGFYQFFDLFLPTLANWLVPAALISFTISNKKSVGYTAIIRVRKGGYVVVGLFLATIVATVFMNHELGLPPFLGMMLGFGALNIYGFYLHNVETRLLSKFPAVSAPLPENEDKGYSIAKPFDIFRTLEKIEWDTLLFFYGIMLCIGGIGALGYLGSLSEFIYSSLGNTFANILIGAASSVFGNIPLTYAVLTMNPPMDLGQWLLITMTAGVGGSLLSIGSAAGVALMGIARGTYTFGAHLKWAWAIMLGFAASVLVHLTLNAELFTLFDK
ncbi:MAG: sodium:proton antiporter NhaD [Bdellovibrionales bacterium]